MKYAPIPLTLDLWALGHSASDIAAKLGFPNHRHVTRIVAHARKIGDKRAVLHVAAGGRLIGRPGRMGRPPVAIPVPALGKPLCSAAHPRTPDNLSDFGHCLTCARAQRRERYARTGK